MSHLYSISWLAHAPLFRIVYISSRNRSCATGHESQQYSSRLTTANIPRRTDFIYKNSATSAYALAHYADSDFNMDGSSLQNTIEMLITAISQTQQCNYSAIGAVAFLCYDTILNMGREYEYVWSQPWSIPKALYIFARYYGIFHLVFTTTVQCLLGLTPIFCKRYFWYYGFGGPILFTSVINFILVLRIAALYKRKTTVLICLAVLFIGELAGELLITTESTIRTVHSAFVAPFGLPLTGCLADPSTVFTLVGWIPCLFVSLVFFLFTLGKFTDILRDKDGRLYLKRLWDPIYVSPLLLSFVRDGSIFFFLIFSILLTCTVINLVIKGALAPVALPWLVAVYSFSGSHLILNLREAARRKVNHVESTTMEMFSLEVRPDPRHTDSTLF